MTVSTAPSSTRRPRAIVDVATLCALVCATSAGVLGAVVVPPAHEPIRIAVALALATVALVLAARVLVAVRHTNPRRHR